MRGGVRNGSGRKRKEPTVTISFRIKETDSKELKALIKSVIDKFHNKD